MKRSSILFNLLGAVGMVGLLSGCSGGGGGSASGAAGGASGSASASGTVTGFGSIYVNGKKFETEDVEVRREDGSSRRCRISTTDTCGLQEGMTVKVSGSFNGSSRSASSISQNDTVEGPITNKTQVDASNGTLAVLGQTVIVDNTTRFDSGISLTSLNINDVIEVYGFVKSDGTIVASFVERKLGAGCSAICEVKGTVKSHDTVTATFQIGGLTVTYDNSTIINDMPSPAGTNWNGRFVEVKGTNFSVIAGVPTLLATKVEPENDGFGNSSRDEFEVEGYVTQAGSASGNVIAFTIGTTQVQTTANTQFRGGTVDEIVVGAKMSAEGRFDGTTLVAKHVKFHASVKLEGDIATVNGSTFTIAGLPGVQVSVNSQTEGGNNLTVGNHVRVRGRINGTSSVIATRIELRDGDNDVDLQGPVQSVAGSTLTILGVDVNTQGISNNNFEGLNDQIIGRDAFFAAVNEGTLVKVKGKLVGGSVVWEEAELED
jgi:Domain of unknown function (DUF5666)